MLSNDHEGNPETEDVFDPASGKRCTAYSENTGQKYCTLYATTAEGKECKSWGVLYKGTHCEQWGERDETYFITETENKVDQNPQFIETEKRLKAQY